MISRHAAALALIGWYLMTPPVYLRKDTPTSPYKPFTNEKAPLLEWEKSGSFDSASECQRKKGKLVERADQVKKVIEAKPSKDETLEAMARSWGWATCIATDDPRLKRR